MKLRRDHRICNHNLSNGKLAMASAVSAAVLYQLSHEDPYIGSRPINRVHLLPMTGMRRLNCGNTDEINLPFKLTSFHVSFLSRVKDELDNLVYSQNMDLHSSVGRAQQR